MAKNAVQCRQVKTCSIRLWREEILPDLGSSRGALISLRLIVINGKYPSYRTFKRTAVELSVHRTWGIKGTAHR